MQSALQLTFLCTFLAHLQIQHCAEGVRGIKSETPREINDVVGGGYLGLVWKQQNRLWVDAGYPHVERVGAVGGG